MMSQPSLVSRKSRPHGLPEACKFQTLAMNQLLQAAANQHSETLDGIKAALAAQPGLHPDPKRQKLEGDPGMAAPELGAPVQLLGMPHPIMASLALPIGGQLQLNGTLLQSSMHEHDDSGEDGTQGHDDRANATKEKNRKAQQRFRQRQKEKMQRLEQEVETLRKMLAEKGGADPTLVKAEQGPSVDQMYEELEQILDQCQELHSLHAITFLQMWLNKMPDDTRRLHYKSVKKRFDGGDREGVKVWVQQALQ